MYAIVRTGGKQFRVSEGDHIAVERLDAAEGDEVTLDDVLLVGGDDGVAVGSPTVEGASVAARVDEHYRDRKVTVYKYKNKTRRRVLRGHRQQRTRLTITGINSGS
ncbi:MAG: 50S ribosomal protein L21 [Chloroflexi bacterium]|nr:50S ribosomal protein L21 [Chloroflexota bacterium]MYE31215.1 50S ribosomal protein L21 [Chloroflexota bacterium]